MPEMTGKEIRTAIRDRVGVLLSKYPCPANIQIMELFDEIFDEEDYQQYEDSYAHAVKGVENVLDFMAGMAAERMFAAIENYFEECEEEESE